MTKAIAKKIQTQTRISEQHLLQDKAYALRSLGKTYKEIGEILGCNWKSASRLCKRFEERSGIGLLDRVTMLNLYRQHFLRAMWAYEKALADKSTVQIPKLVTAMTDILSHMEEASGLKIDRKMVLERKEITSNTDTEGRRRVIDSFIQRDSAKVMESEQQENGQK